MYVSLNGLPYKISHLLSSKLYLPHANLFHISSSNQIKGNQSEDISDILRRVQPLAGFTAFTRLGDLADCSLVIDVGVRRFKVARIQYVNRVTFHRCCNQRRSVKPSVIRTGLNRWYPW